MMISGIQREPLLFKEINKYMDDLSQVISTHTNVYPQFRTVELCLYFLMKNQRIRSLLLGNDVHVHGDDEPTTEKFFHLLEVFISHVPDDFKEGETLLRIFASSVPKLSNCWD